MRHEGGEERRGQAARGGAPEEGVVVVTTETGRARDRRKPRAKLAIS